MARIFYSAMAPPNKPEVPLWPNEFPPTTPISRSLHERPMTINQKAITKQPGCYASASARFSGLMQNGKGRISSASADRNGARWALSGDSNKATTPHKRASSRRCVWPARSASVFCRQAKREIYDEPLPPFTGRAPVCHCRPPSKRLGSVGLSTRTLHQIHRGDSRRQRPRNHKCGAPCVIIR
jgi:hypothetical protein